MIDKNNDNLKQMKRNRTVLFCRVSSKEQEETGYSLTSQEKLLKEYAYKRELKIAKIFSISESASGKTQRQTFSKMMSFVKKEGIKVVICEKVDRLTRNFKDAVLIDEWLEKDEERQVHLVKDSLTLHKNSRSQEKLNWGIRILFAKNYIDNLSEEVKKGYKEKISQGWMPHQPPLGYKTVGEERHKTHEVDTNISPFIKKLYELYLTGEYSFKRLEKEAQAMGLKSKRGNKLYAGKINEILKNPFYHGYFKWGGKVYEGKQKPIVSKEMFERVQILLASRSTPIYSRHNFTYKSMIRCAECKGLITWEKQKSYLYGHCNHYKNCTQKTWVRERDINKKILKDFDGLEINNPRLVEWIRKALKDSHKDEIEYHSKSQTELKRNYDRLQNRLDRLYEDKLDGKIPEDFYDRKFEQYSKERSFITDSIQKHSKANLKYYEQGVTMFNLSQRLKSAFGKANEADKRKLLRYVYSNLTLDEGDLALTYTPTFQLLSKAVKVTNSSKLPKTAKSTSKTFELANQGEHKGSYEEYFKLNPVVRG